MPELGSILIAVLVILAVLLVLTLIFGYSRRLS